MFTGENIGISIPVPLSLPLSFRFFLCVLITKQFTVVVTIRLALDQMYHNQSHNFFTPHLNMNLNFFLSFHSFFFIRNIRKYHRVVHHCLLLTAHCLLYANRDEKLKTEQRWVNKKNKQIWIPYDRTCAGQKKREDPKRKTNNLSKYRNWKCEKDNACRQFAVGRSKMEREANHEIASNVVFTSELFLSDLLGYRTVT